MSTIVLAGRATDTGRGDNGISSVTVNGVRANNDTAAGAGTANWSLTVALSFGPNVLTVIAKDGSPVQNAAPLTITITSTASPTASTAHLFPQTTRILVNPDLNIATDCTTLLHGMTTDGANTFNVRLAARVTVVSGPTRGGQAFQSGYATTQCSSVVFGELLYSFYDENGIKLSEATVFSSPSAQRVQILADTRGGSRVGLAIANDSDQGNTYTISFYDASGTVIASAIQSLAGRSSVAKFIDELVTLPANYYGKVIVSSPSGASASIIGLRFTGSVFTTIPETVR